MPTYFGNMHDACT